MAKWRASRFKPVQCPACHGESYVPAWKRWAVAIVSEILAVPLFLSIFFGWHFALAAVVAVAAVLILSDIFILKLRPSGKEPLEAYTFPLFQALLLSTVVAVFVAVLFYRVVVVG
jgi:predicted MFS family arabinose efflux permease